MWPWPTRSIWAHRAGASVIASMYEIATATDSVTPNCRKYLPMMPVMNATGKKIAITASVAASAANVISLVPSAAALKRSLPISPWR